MELRTAEVTVNELRIYPEDDDVIFIVRDLLTCEIREILSLGTEDAFFKLLQNEAAPGGVVDLDCRHRVEIVVRGTVDPGITYAFAVRLARDFREVLFRLSDAVLTLGVQRIGFENLAAVPRMH